MRDRRLQAAIVVTLGSADPDRVGVVVVVHYAIIPRITRLNKPARMAVSAQTARWFRLMRPKSTAKGVALTQLVDLNAHTRGFSKLCVTADCRPPLWLRLDQLTLIASASLPLRLAT
jgi:hypothetical protein